MLKTLLNPGLKQDLSKILSKDILYKSFTANRLPLNLGILFVPQQEAWIIERFGKFRKTLEPGLNLCIPIIDRVSYVQSLKEIAINIPDQPAVTQDNVVLQINGVLFLKVRNPYLASYGIEDAEFAITQLAQTNMRSELGKITLDQVFKERETLNANIVLSINNAAEPWGIDCLRYEIRDILLPDKIQDAMQMQVEAERRKRAAVLESEGLREAAINKAEGMKQSKILQSEALKTEQINAAIGQAESIVRVAESKAEAIQRISEALSQQNGSHAAQLKIAEQYIEAFSQLAKETNTVLLPSQPADAGSMVAQAMSIFKTMSPSATETGEVDLSSKSDLPSYKTYNMKETASRNKNRFKSPE